MVQGCSTSTRGEVKLRTLPSACGVHCEHKGASFYTKMHTFWDAIQWQDCGTFHVTCAHKVPVPLQLTPEIVYCNDMCKFMRLDALLSVTAVVHWTYCTTMYNFVQKFPSTSFLSPVTFTEACWRLLPILAVLLAPLERWISYWRLLRGGFLIVQTIPLANCLIGASVGVQCTLYNVHTWTGVIEQTISLANLFTCSPKQRIPGSIRANYF
jgi:hypothetical protein